MRSSCACVLDLVAEGVFLALHRLHMEILSKADEGEHGLAWKDADIIEAFEVHIRMVERVRQRFVEEGLGTALSGRKQSRHKSPSWTVNRKRTRLLGMQRTTGRLCPQFRRESFPVA